jgi:hypothetical protein
LLNTKRSTKASRIRKNDTQFLNSWLADKRGLTNGWPFVLNFLNK